MHSDDILTDSKIYISLNVGTAKHSINQHTFIFKLHQVHHNNKIMRNSIQNSIILLDGALKKFLPSAGRIGVVGSRVFGIVL